MVISIGILGVRAEPLQAGKKASHQTMTLDQLEAIVVEEAIELRGRNGQWQFVLDEFPMALLTDVEHDRMTIIAPIIQENKVTSEERKKVLEANFHTALDARDMRVPMASSTLRIFTSSPPFVKIKSAQPFIRSPN